MPPHHLSLINMGMNQKKNKFEMKIGELSFGEFLNIKWFLNKLSGIDLNDNRVN